MFNPLNIKRRCKDAERNYIEKGWYFDSFWGFIRFVNENAPEHPFGGYSWEVEYGSASGETKTRTFNSQATKECLKITGTLMAYCVENAEWAIKRLEETGKEKDLADLAEKADLEMKKAVQESL